jgi:hypothetical protein
VIRAQGCPDDRLQQRLVLEEPARVDQEDALEGLCWLLLNRVAVQRQTPAQRRGRLAEVPDWLSTGLAQNLYAELRQRNARIFERRWAAGESRRARAVVQGEILPSGRWPEKADAAMLVGWILSLPEGREVFDDILSRVAAGEPVDLEAVAAAAGLAGERDLAVAWDLWAAQEVSRTDGLGVVTPERIEDLKAALMIRPADLGAPHPPGAPPVLAPADLVELREEAWARDLAWRMAQRLAAMTAGQSEEFSLVAAAYRDYFLLVAGPGAKPGATRPPVRSLSRQLQKAERALVRLELDVERRRAFLDRFAEGAEPVPPPAGDEAVRAYLDGVEDALDEGAP